MAFTDVRHLLMEVLPSCAVAEQGRILRIQTHLEKIQHHLWALNALILDAEARAMLEEGAPMAWLTDVGTIMVDLEDLLDSITERQDKVAAASDFLSRALLDATREAFRLRAVCKLKKLRRALVKLVCRGFAIHLREDILLSMDPCRDEYAAILRDEVIQRDEDVEKVVEILQRPYFEDDKEEEDEEDEDEKIDEVVKEKKVSTQKQRSAQDEEEEEEKEVEKKEKEVEDEEKEKEEEEEEIDEQADDEEISERIDADQNEYVPFVIAIQDEEYNFFGMGKTTLAQMIYHDPWVKQHFRHRIWVDMSKLFYFDILGIAREFARAIAAANEEENCSHLQSLTNLQQFWIFLHQRLSGSNYLLILDNFPSLKKQNDDLDEWNQLQRILFRIGGPGSTILLTTTNENELLRIRSTTFRKYYLKGLKRDALVELFMKYVLSRPVADQVVHLENTLSSRDLREVHRVLKREFGSKNIPQMVPKIFGFVRRYIEFDQWRKWISKFDSTEGMEFQLLTLIVLHHLPATIGRLNLYSKFYGESLHKEDFMNMMFAQGVTPNSSDKITRLEYLDDNLWMDLEFLKSNKFCFSTSIGQNSTIIPKHCFHLRLLIHSDASLSLPKTFFEENCKKLRTLLILPSDGEEDAASEIQKSQTTEIPLQYIFANQVHLRILHLQTTRIQRLPKTISKLKHLRYLNLSHNEIEKLPPSICDLWNLQVLKLAHCEKLQKLPVKINRLWKLKILDIGYCEKLLALPATITSLVNLQELHLQGCLWLEQLPEGFSNLKKLAELNIQKCVYLSRMPHEIGQITDLIRLSGYAAYDDYIGISALAVLKNLLHLKELCLQRLERISNSELPAVRDIKLHEKSMLQIFSLTWQWGDYCIEEEAVNFEALSQEPLQLELIEDLRPNLQSLQMLEIISYVGSKIPSWMTNEKEPYLSNLREMRLINLKKCERLPPAGHLPLLEIIEISGMELISKVDDAFYGKENRPFPKLRRLTFSHMPELKKWIPPKGFSLRQYLACLKYVTSIQCPKFDVCELLQYCNEKQSLEIWLDNRMFLTSKYIKWGWRYRLGELKLVGCRAMRILPEHMQPIIRGLEKLSIIWCHELVTLPDWLEDLKRLREVAVFGCTKLSWMPPGLMSKPYLKIRIKNCPRLRLNLLN